MLPILALRHVACEGPGLLAELAGDRGIELRVVDMPAEFPRWPEPDQFGGLVVLGGPMSVYDTMRFPWVKDEVRLLRRCVDEGVPILGICLGAQLLAAACGAKVYAGGRKEIGWGPVRLRRGAQTDPLFEEMPDSLTVFHWHGDTFDLPEDALLLASSPLYPYQAYRVSDRWYGVQFHLEVTQGMPQEWAKYYESELAAVGGPTLGGALSESDARVAELRPAAERILGRWLERFAAG